MMCWSSLISRFKSSIEDYNIPDYDKRVSLLKLTLSLWIIVMIFPVLVYHEFVYDFDLMNHYFFNNLTVKLFKSLPELITSFIERKPYFVSFALIFLVVAQHFLKKWRLFFTLGICLVLNFHFCLTSIVNSGATVIVTNFASFMVLLDFFDLLQRKNILGSTYKFYVFFGMKIQICIVYLISGLVKLSSPLWISGAATYYIFTNERYFKFPAVLPFIQQSSFIESLSTFLPICYLLVFPFAVWTRKGWLIVAVSFVFHSLIAIFMGLREFLIFPLLDYCLFCDVNNVSLVKNRIKQKLSRYKAPLGEGIIAE